MQCPVFTDTVEDNHVIVDGVTDDGQDGRNEGLVDVEVEREDTREQREETDDDDCGVGKGDDTAETPGPALETERDVGENTEKGEEYGDDGAALDVAGDGRTDFVGGDDTVRVVQRVAEGIERDRLLVEALEGVEELLLDFGVDLGGSP